MIGFGLTPGKLAILGSASGALAMLNGESRGLALDFTTATGPQAGLGQVAVRDTTTPANNKTNRPVDEFLSQSGTSPKLVLWSDGLYRWTGHNLLPQSETFDNAAWINIGSLGGAVTANVAAGPTGAITADRFPFSVQFGNLAQINIPTIAGATYTYSIWIKRETGNTALHLYLGSAQTAVTVTDAWAQYSVTFVASGATENFGVQDRNAAGQGNVLLWGAQLNRGTVPTAYHVTTAAAWYGVPIEYDPSTGKFYALVEPQATNIALYASDFTNAAWVKSNMTAALTATGPDGVANSASTLTATAGNATALQAITSGSASRVTSMFVKRRTGSGVVNLTQDNGGTWTAVTVTAGWTNVPLAAVTSANPTVGIRIVTSGDAVDVAWFQHELTAVTSPIPTFAATVTRGGDDLNFAKASTPYTITAGTWVAKMRIYVDAGTSRILAHDATATTDFHLATNQRVGIYNGAVSLEKQGSVFTNLDVVGATAFDGTGRAATLQGLPSATDANAMPAAPTTFHLGTHLAGAGQIFMGRIYRLVYVPRRMTDAELQLKTAA